jgi:hypothetical protein
VRFAEPSQLSSKFPADLGHSEVTPEEFTHLSVDKPQPTLAPSYGNRHCNSDYIERVRLYSRSFRTTLHFAPGL